MKHVFVESNWVFAFCAPAHHRTPEAERLVTYAGKNQISLYVPSVALREGADAIRRKCTDCIPKDFQEFQRWAIAAGKVTLGQVEAARPLLESYLEVMQSGRLCLDSRVDSILNLPGVHAFGLTDRMLEKAIELRSLPDLKPFDEAILAAVLVKASELPRTDEKIFCELDGDLGTHDKNGHVRQAFLELYGEVGITFKRDFRIF